MGVYLMSVHLMDVHLMGVHPIGMRLTGMHLLAEIMTWQLQFLPMSPFSFHDSSPFSPLSMALEASCIKSI
jgi:hypothetical protein